MCDKNYAEAPKGTIVIPLEYDKICEYQLEPNLYPIGPVYFLIKGEEYQCYFPRFGDITDSQSLNPKIQIQPFNLEDSLRNPKILEVRTLFALKSLEGSPSGIYEKYIEGRKREIEKNHKELKSFDKGL